MRTVEQIQQIKNRIIEPYVVENFVSKSEVLELVSIFENDSDNKIHKNTGPITLNIGKYQQHLDIFPKIFSRLEKEIGPHEIYTGFFFTTHAPHIIHNDDQFELPPNIYRGITIPLTMDDDIERDEYPKLCMFDQFYFHGPAKFFNGSANIPTYYNKQVYEYSDVDGLTDKPFNGPDYFTHLKPSWLEGLSFHSALEWKPTNALIFDSTRLHCASDFRKLGIKRKLGLSIFTLKH